MEEKPSSANEQTRRKAHETDTDVGADAMKTDITARFTRDFASHVGNHRVVSKTGTPETVPDETISPVPVESASNLDLMRLKVQQAEADKAAADAAQAAAEAESTLLASKVALFEAEHQRSTSQSLGSPKKVSGQKAGLRPLPENHSERGSDWSSVEALPTSPTRSSPGLSRMVSRLENDDEAAIAVVESLRRLDNVSRAENDGEADAAYRQRVRKNE